MANAIDQAFDAVNKGIADMRKDNDASLAELKKGNEVRFRELQEKCDQQENLITDLLKTKNDLIRQKDLIDQRVDLLEALADRPKGDILVKLTNEDEELFFKWMRSGFTDRKAQADRDQLQRKAIEMKVDTVTAGTALLGGNAVPKVISDQVERLILKTSGVVEAIGVKTVGTSDYHRVVTISGQSGAWAAELGSRSQANAPNTRDIKPTQGELYAYLYASKESLQDMMFDVATWLINDVAESHAVKLATSIYSGNGSGQCTGMTNTTPVTTADYASPMRAAAAYQFVSHSGIDTSSPNRITLDILQAAIANLAPGYRGGAKFAMNTFTQGYVRRLKDTTNQYLWQPSVQAGQPDVLFGYPVFTWEDLANGNTVDGFCAAFGNWGRSYELVNRGPLEIVTDNITTVGTTKFWVSRRWGGIPCNNDALKFVRNQD
jgi:HK97 family phage major capsid protein